MPKTKATFDLEKALHSSTSKMGVFGVKECTLGFNGEYGGERVDYITIDTKGIVRCYEIKQSKQDFYSSASKSYIGHYNYLVCPEELYEQVKDDVPSHIGVHNGWGVIKNPKKQELGLPLQVILMSIIRSMSREAEKYYKIAHKDKHEEDRKKINSLERRIKNMKNSQKEYDNEIRNFMRKYPDVRKLWNKFMMDED